MPIPSNNLERREPSDQEDNIVRTADTASRPLPVSCPGKDGDDVASDAPSWTVVMGTGSPHRLERG
jgi:hypothetical protein